MRNIFVKHLSDVGESYFLHAKHALYISVNTLYVSIILLIHAVFPFLFTTMGSRIMTKITRSASIRNKFVNSKNKPCIAIIGFGASGIIKLYNLVKSVEPNTIIDIFDKDFLSLGIAYDTNNMEHLLNIRASNMSAITGEDQHFVQWLSDNSFEYGANDFVPRTIYGLYLKDLVRMAKDIAYERKVLIKFFHTEVKNINHMHDCFIVNDNVYSKCYLCTGITLRNGKQNYWSIPKSTLKSYITGKQTIHIIGASLSAFDAILEILSFGFSGNFVLYSRSGLIPHAHSDSKATSNVLDINSWSMKHFISLCRKSQDWRSIFDSIRPISQQIWQNTSVAQKKSIIKHGLRFWGIHRHRAPQKIHNIITSLMESGNLTIKKDKPPANAIDCTGFNLHCVTDLEASLIKNNIATNDDLNMGIVSLKANFHIIGARNFGSLLETTAIPEIRFQASQNF